MRPTGGRAGIVSRDYSSSPLGGARLLVGGRHLPATLPSAPPPQPNLSGIGVLKASAPQSASGKPRAATYCPASCLHSSPLPRQENLAERRLLSWSEARGSQTSRYRRLKRRLLLGPSFLGSGPADLPLSPEATKPGSCHFFALLAPCAPYTEGAKARTQSNPANRSGGTRFPGGANRRELGSCGQSASHGPSTGDAEGV